MQPAGRSTSFMHRCRVEFLHYRAEIIIQEQMAGYVNVNHFSHQGGCLGIGRQYHSDLHALIVRIRHTC